MEIDNCAQVDCFFGTPEVILRPRQRIGGDGMPDLDTPGLSMIKDKSYATLSPGSARRKPFHDVSHSASGYTAHALCSPACALREGTDSHVVKNPHERVEIC